MRGFKNALPYDRYFDGSIAGPGADSFSLREWALAAPLGFLRVAFGGYSHNVRFDPYFRNASVLTTFS
jgi:hypothetical protein